MDLLQHFRLMARNNAWSNARILSACASLSEEAFAAARTGFFPSLQAMLNHILVVDRAYLGDLEETGRPLGIEDIACPGAKRWRRSHLPPLKERRLPCR